MIVTPAIELNGVSRSFKGAKALSGVDLEVTSGVVGLLGPNGAGKTTLLRILATILSADAGSVRILGRDPSDGAERTEIRRRLGYLPQELGYPRGFTTYRFIDYMAVLKEIEEPAARRAEVRRVLEDVGLADRAAKRLRDPLRRPAPSRRAGAGVAGLAGPARPRRAHHRPRPRAAGVAPPCPGRAGPRSDRRDRHAPHRGRRRALRARDRAGQRVGELPGQRPRAGAGGARARLAGRRPRSARPGLLAHRHRSLPQSRRRAAGCGTGGADAGRRLPPAAWRHRSASRRWRHDARRRLALTAPRDPLVAGRARLDRGEALRPSPCSFWSASCWRCSRAAGSTVRSSSTTRSFRRSSWASSGSSSPRA